MFPRPGGERPMGDRIALTIAMFPRPVGRGLG